MENTSGRRSRGSRLTLSLRVSLLLAFLLIASATVSTIFASSSVQGQSYAQSQEAVGNVHAAVAALVRSEYSGIAAYRQQTLEGRKQQLKDVAAPLVVALDELRAAAQSGDVTDSQARRRALALLKNVRFGNNDYFFTYDRDLNAISHPDPRFQGRNLTDLQDADGKYVLRKIRRVALTRGSGYVNYRWERLDGAQPSPKVGYVFHYEPWDWIIGTGVYVDDIDAEVQRQVEQVGTTLHRTFDEIQFSGDGFFFILDRDGDIVASGNPEVVGTARTPQGRDVISAVLAAAPDEPDVEIERTFHAPWAAAAAEPWAVRVSTIGGDLDWVLVSAVPQEQLEAPGRTLSWQLMLLTAIVLICGLAAGVLVSRRITKPVDDITAAARALRDDTFDPTTLEAAAKRSDEVGDLARAFQTMGTEIVEREKRLREQVEQLSVQIDRGKVAEEVQEITESEYFQRLKSRSKELRDRKL